MPLSVSISDAFDGGNIKFIKQQPNANDPRIIDVILQIKPDLYTELEEICHMQYFSFRSTVSGLADHDEGSSVKLKYILQNAHKVSYPEAWPGSTVCYSTNVEDADGWRRVRDTFYTEGKLTWEFTHEHHHGTTTTTTTSSVYFSYFPPYSYSRHLRLVAQCATANAASAGAVVVSSLGQSLQGREIECITTGTGPLTCWIIHRQHPGETMAEHFAEGLLTRLLGLPDKCVDGYTNKSNNNKTDGEEAYALDEQVQKLTQLYTFYIVPWYVALRVDECDGSC